eukprot:144862_1
MLSDEIVDDSAVELLNRRDNNINVNELKAKHDELLSFSIKFSKYWMCIAMLQWFFFCCRWYIWILYARSLGQHNERYLAFSVYSIYFIQIFSNLFWGSIADYYTYDAIAVFLSIFIVIGLIMESIAFNYSLLLIGTIIVDVFRSTNVLGIGFITTYLPNHYAVKYLGYRLAMIGAANLLGPVIGGIMTSYINIKSPFYLSTLIAISTLLFFIYINGTQNKIHSQQLEMKQLYDHDILEEGDDLLNIDYQFPVSTQKFILQQKK